MKRYATLCLAAALTACATMTSAGTLLDVSVINRTTGQRIATHHHDGKLYIAGTPGEKYAVRIANRTGGRVLTVVSVDGVNAVTGETAAADQNGYVLSPRQAFEINGWRKNLNEVAAFYFTALPDSYAARTDRPDNVGVIGVAVFREWTPPPAPPASIAPSPQARAEARRSDDAASAPAARESAKPAEREEKLGTGHGEREWSAVRHTQFRRASERPNETITIYYDSYNNLVARGIIARTPVVVPNPFPGGQFVPDPRS